MVRQDEQTMSIKRESIHCVSRFLTQAAYLPIWLLVVYHCRQVASKHFRQSHPKIFQCAANATENTPSPYIYHVDRIFTPHIKSFEYKVYHQRSNAHAGQPHHKNGINEKRPAKKKKQQPTMALSNQQQ